MLVYCTPYSFLISVIFLVYDLLHCTVLVADGNRASHKIDSAKSLS